MAIREKYTLNEQFKVTNCDLENKNSTNNGAA